MNVRIIFLFLFFLFPSVSIAQLDLEQEVLIIPDTHNEKPYGWNASVNPEGYELSLSSGSARSGVESEFLFSVASKEGRDEQDVHVFVTDEDLRHYTHVRAVRKSDGAYAFRFNPPQPGKYRFEVVFRTGQEWVNLRKDMRIKRGSWKTPAALPGDEDYEIRMKLIPKTPYAEHVTTFLYEIRYKGEPVTNLDRVDGFDMQVAAWDENLREFIHAMPKQSLGGPEVAVSIVFMKTGKHKVFAEFSHLGATQRIESVVRVYPEPGSERPPILAPDYWEKW